MSGIEIRAEYKDGSVVVPGMDFNKLFQSSSDTSQKKPVNSRQQMPPISFGEFELRNATIILTSGDNNVRIPFGMKAKPFITQGNEPASGYDIQVWLYPNIIDLLPGVTIVSQINMDARYDFRTAILDLKLTISDMNVEYHGLHVRNSPGNVPLTIEARKKQDDISVKFSRFCMVSPLPLELSMGQNTDYHLHLSPEQFDMKGKICVTFHKDVANSHFPFPLKLANTASLPLQFKGKKRGDQWRFSLNSPGSGSPLQFSGEAEKIVLHPKVLSVSGKGNGSDGSIRLAMNMSPMHYNSDALRIGIPHLLIFGIVHLEKAQFSTIHAFAKVRDAACNVGNLHIGKIDAKIPFQWPYPSREMDTIKFTYDPKRYSTVGEITYSGMDVGKISAIPYQNGLHILFAGRHTDFIPDLQVNFTGTAGINDDGRFIAKLDFKTPEPGKVRTIDLGKFSPQLKGMFFEGNLNIDGTCKVTGSTITSSALVAMHHATIEVPKKKMILEGLDLNLSIPDLYNFRSDPDQVLTFKRFAWGDIEMNEGEMAFQIESPSSFSLKKTGFSWCGGHVYTHGLQIKSAKRELDIICYCDRLKLATLLKQFHLAQVEGDGTVNGRIPLRYTPGKINIPHGFLYSTPGEGGTINISTDTLTPGTGDVQQSIQMQIAREALKNFRYDWVKLSLLSQGDNLMIQMQMDGKPADLLPFGFNKKMGLVKRERPQAHFQGIRFHINFKLPLDEMITYGSGLSDFMQNR